MSHVKMQGGVGISCHIKGNWKVMRLERLCLYKLPYQRNNQFKKQVVMVEFLVCKGKMYLLDSRNKLQCIYICKCLF